MQMAEKKLLPRFPITRAASNFFLRPLKTTNSVQNQQVWIPQKKVTSILFIPARCKHRKFAKHIKKFLSCLFFDLVFSGCPCFRYHWFASYIFYISFSRDKSVSVSQATYRRWIQRSICTCAKSLHSRRMCIWADSGADD